MTPFPPSGQSAVQTPCVGICLMDRSGLCRGCARTLEEIGCWTSLSASERIALMEQLPARKAGLPSDSTS
jgi:predicted Fe-S protein YdhL (DUF1289 family)